MTVSFDFMYLWIQGTRYVGMIKTAGNANISGQVSKVETQISDKTNINFVKNYLVYKTNLQI